MRNAHLLVFCLLPALAVAEERKAAPDGAVRVALAPAGAPSRSLPAEAVRPPTCAAEMDPQSLRELVQSEARRAGVDEKLALAILDQESANGINLNSPKGARGPMMLMPETAAQYGVQDICNPVENVRGSMQFLKDLVAQFHGNMMLVAAAYNAGSERVHQAKGVPANSETVRYVAAVTNQYYGLGELSVRRAKIGAPKNRGVQAASENESSLVTEDGPSKDQNWIGGSVLYVSPDDEGESK